MTLSVKHATQSSVPDIGDGRLSSNAWDEAHALTGAANMLVGFDGSGVGTEIDPATLSGAAIANRTALAALANPSGTRSLIEAGREGMFVWDSADRSGAVAADTAKGLFVAPASDTTGASGAWVRKYDGAVKPDWFGLIRGENAGANGPTNDAAFTAMFAILLALAPAIATNKALADVDLGYGVIEVTSTPTPPATCKIDGRGAGHFNNSGTYAGTVIRPYGCSGFALNYTRSSLTNLAIQGNMTTGVPESEQHGVSFTQTVFLTNVKVRQMPGDGFNIDGQTGAGHLPDSSRLLGVEAWGCRDGLSIGVTGGNGDANVIQVIGGFFNGNRRWGVNDQGFLGNIHIGWEGASNGVQARNDGVDIAATLVSYSGNIYGAIAGQETGASTNAPSGDTTDNTWWYYKKVGGVSTGRPAWFNGMLVRAGGILYTNNINAPHVFQGCYAESDQGFAQVIHPTQIYGGNLANYVWRGSTGVAEYVDTNGTKHLTRPLQFSDSYTGTDETINVTIGESSTTKGLLKFNSSVGAPSTWRLKFTSGTTGGLLFDYGNSSSTTAFQILGPNTTDQAGTGAARPYALRPTILLVQPNVTVQSDNARRLMIDTAAPSSAAHGLGEYCLRKTSTQSDPFADRCVTAGTPGTWQSLYSGYGTNPIGYVTGAGVGGNVTQGTDKGTAVTNNKLSGTITMNAALLAAGGIVSFTLNNSQIGPDDFVMPRIRSGYATSGSYRTWAEGNASGSRTIFLENISGGGLSEAVVIGFAMIKGASD